MVMAVSPEQRLADGQPDPGRTSNTGAERPCTVAVMSPKTFPATNTEINCPGATVTGGYRYPIPVKGFADAFCPYALGGNATHNIANTAKYLITLRPRSEEHTSELQSL